MKLFAALALTFALAASAQAAAGPLAVAGAWSRPAVAGTNAVGYLTLANSGRTADALVRVESPLAARVEMHSSSMAGGVMSMRPEPRVAVPAGGKVAFAPGGYHLMLIGLTRTVKAGDTIPATLTFASGARLKTAFAVGSGVPAAAMDHMRH
jgi:copper(I)-binding protein